MIAVYIVTFRRNDVLNANLRSLWESTNDPTNIEVTVLANHPDVHIAEENRRPNLRLLPNTTRSADAWGYLSRDWNFALLDGFRDWRNPRNLEWCVLAQNDVTWLPGWDDYLRSESRFDLITQPRGDQAIAIKIEAVRRIGFFDERFCTLHFHEFDYFFRAMACMEERVSINDDHGPADKASWNPIGNVLTATAAFGFNEGDNLHTGRTWREMRNLLFHKWALTNLDQAEDKHLVLSLNKAKLCLPPEINWYPFFWDGCLAMEERWLLEYQDVVVPEAEPAAEPVPLSRWKFRRFNSPAECSPIRIAP